jgi:DNA-binding CsgD family transcriptional regulator
VDTALKAILEIYRAAQDTPVEEFQTLALKLLQTLVPFRSAMWANLDHKPTGLTAYSMHLFNEPDEFMKDMPVMNSRYPSTIQSATRQCGEGIVIYTPALFSGKDQADMRAHIRRYGHEHNFAIADLDRPYTRGEWLALYRPERDPAFSERDRRLATLLTPHLVEAMTINRRLALGAAMGENDSLGGTRALIRSNGTVIHSGERFCELLSTDWPDWRFTRLPPFLLASLQRKGTATVANGSVTITATKLGELLLLRAKKVSPLARLSEREHTVVRLYASGHSYKEVARQLGISPVTVRNFIQHAYRKLGIDNKAALAQLVQAEAPETLRQM